MPNASTIYIFSFDYLVTMCLPLICDLKATSCFSKDHIPVITFRPADRAMFALFHTSSSVQSLLLRPHIHNNPCPRGRLRQGGHRCSGRQVGVSGGPAPGQPQFSRRWEHQHLCINQMNRDENELPFSLCWLTVNGFCRENKVQVGGCAKKNLNTTWPHLPALSLSKEIKVAALMLADETHVISLINELWLYKKNQGCRWLTPT